MIPANSNSAGGRADAAEAAAGTDVISLARIHRLRRSICKSDVLGPCFATPHALQLELTKAGQLQNKRF